MVEDRYRAGALQPLHPEDACLLKKRFEADMCSGKFTAQKKQAIARCDGTHGNLACVVNSPFLSCRFHKEMNNRFGQSKPCGNRQPTTCKQRTRTGYRRRGVRSEVPSPNAYGEMLLHWDTQTPATPIAGVNCMVHDLLH